MSFDFTICQHGVDLTLRRCRLCDAKQPTVNSSTPCVNGKRHSWLAVPYSDKCVRCGLTKYEVRQGIYQPAHDPTECVNDFLASEEAERDLAAALAEGMPNWSVQTFGPVHTSDVARAILRSLRVGGQS